MNQELVFETYCSELSPHSPCGEDVEYDPEFQEMIRAARGEQPREMGTAKKEGKPPDWEAVRNLAISLFTRTRDLQVARYLTRALIYTNGFEGYQQGVALIHGLLEHHWDHLYPTPDADDHYPVFRVNVLASFNDESIDILGNLPLTESHGFGRFSWRDMQVALGNLKPDADKTAPVVSEIDAAFADTVAHNTADLDTKYLSVSRAREDIKAIEILVRDQVGTENAVNFSTLIRLLDDIRDRLGRSLAKNADDTPVNGQSQGNPELPFEGGGFTSNGTIRNREDVIHLLDLTCQYFDREEPSSPVPFLLRRAKRMVSMNFMEILADLTPESMGQAETICGIDKDQVP